MSESKLINKEYTNSKEIAEINWSARKDSKTENIF